METVTLSAVIHRETDLYVAECPEVGAVSQGYTVDEAVASLKEAAELYLEEFPVPSVEQSILATFDAVFAEAAHA